MAGLQLAGLSLRGQADVGGFVASFSGSHRYVLDFLAEEVLDRQPEPPPASRSRTSAGCRVPRSRTPRLPARGHRPPR